MTTKIIIYKFDNNDQVEFLNHSILSCGRLRWFVKVTFSHNDSLEYQSTIDTSSLPTEATALRIRKSAILALR